MKYEITITPSDEKDNAELTLSLNTANGGTFEIKWLYIFYPWIAHAKTVSQISPSNGTLFKIKV